eukprot:7073251-Prymnesium_polylepis.1
MSFQAAVASVATAVCAFALAVGAAMLRSDATLKRLMALPAPARALVSGLLAGLGLVVMLPSALEMRPSDCS